MIAHGLRLETMLLGGRRHFHKLAWGKPLSVALYPSLDSLFMPY